MSSSSRSEKRSTSFCFSNSDFNDSEETFTDLHSCDLKNDTDSQSSCFTSSDLYDDDDDDRQVNRRFISSKSENKNGRISSSEPFNDIRDLIRDDLYKFVFIPNSKQFDNYIRCHILREKFDLFETFHLEVEYGNNGKSICLLVAERQLQVIGYTQYTISVLSKFTNDYYSVKLQSNNLSGTHYTLYHLNEDQHKQLARILYETNFFGLKGPRKIEVILPKINHHEDYSKEQNDCFIHLHNKQPIWNPYKRAYVLNFEGRDNIIIGSVKNLQMVIQTKENVEEIVMQFGRISENQFCCDFRYPLSLIQAFGIALSAFEPRLFRD